MPSAERVQWAKFRVSAVTIVGLLILGTLFFLLTGGTLFRSTAEIYLYMPDATGLAKGSPVRVDGVAVGKVGFVGLSGSSQPNRVVQVVMDVDRDRLPSITADSTAQAAADTLVGDQFIAITTGRSQQRLQPKGEIQFKGSPDLMKGLDMAQFDQQLRKMDAVLTDLEQGKSPLGQFVSGQVMYNDVVKNIAALQGAIHSATSITTAVGHEIYTEELYRKISDPLVKLDQSLAVLQSGQGSAGQFLRDNAQYEQARAQLAGLRKSIAEIGSGEWMKSDAMYTDWNRMVVGLIRTVEEFGATPMMLSAAPYDELNGVAKELQGTLKDFRENPRKYLRLKVF
jgi:phospholipid/cholesterol/gamma-HCH transport system substrate-binding protein